MKNSQLKAGYNVQITTQNQFIFGYALYRWSGGARCFHPFMHELLEALPKVPTQVNSGASEENYLFATEEEKVPLLNY